MSDRTWRGIRTGSQMLDVYNESQLVYLFDEANLQTLKNSGADFQLGFAENEAEVDKQLRWLARDGLYVAYELEQDDEVAVEVVVGPPLTRKELAVGRWLKPQKAFLKLPSGALRVDTANTLPIHEDDPEDKPGIATVPPGDYVLSLYRLDWKELQNDGLIADGRPWLGPGEVIVLTPAAEAKPVRNKSLLRYPQPDIKVWQGKYEIDGGTFRGLAMTQFWWDHIHVNLDRAAVEKLGLQPGMSFRLEMHTFVFDVIYYGDAEPQQMLYSEWAKPLAGERPEFGVAYRLIGIPESDHYLTFPRVVSTKAFPIHQRWLPAIVTLLPERYDVPPSKSGM